MKNKSASQSAFFYFRTSIGLLLVVAGVFLALLGMGQFSAQAQLKSNPGRNALSPLVPPMFDCAQIRSLGINIQENFRAGAIMIACGEATGGSPEPEGQSFVQRIIQEISAPLLGGTDVDLVNPGPEAGTHITQSETFALANPDDPNEIVVAYNDSRGVFASPINISGASVSTNGGATFTRLTKAGGQSPFSNTFGDPVVLYNSPTGTFFTVWLDAGCGAQGLGGYKSTNPSDPNSWTHFCIHTGSGDDRESGYSDNSPSSPFNGRLYVSWNDFNRFGGALFVRFSPDNGTTWTERRLTTSFVRNVQITGDPATGTVYVAGMDEGAGGLTTRSNKIYKSTDGGLTWTNSYTGPFFNAPGRTTCPNSYFACMFTGGGGYWRHMGWGQPAALNNIVHYVYDSRNTGNGDAADVFYIRSTDGGVTFGAPFKLNTDTTTRAQWQPNLSVAADGSLLSVWYDERETANCVKSDETVPCYRMWGRRSVDGGITWLPNEAFSDVISPLPGQPDSGIIAEYAGDYDYSSSVGNTHIHPWTDGRVVVNSASQQDAFVDQDPAGGGGGVILVSASSRVPHGTAGTFDIAMPLSGTSGVEDRDTGGSFRAIFTFNTAVTSGAASVVGGTATAGSPTFSGNEMRVRLTGVTNQQIVTIQVSNVNGGGGSNDVDFGFLIGDATSNHLVDKPDVDEVRAQIGQPVTSANFQDDVDADGTIGANDVTTVRTHRNESIP